MKIKKRDTLLGGGPIFCVHKQSIKLSVYDKLVGYLYLLSRCSFVTYIITNINVSNEFDL